MNLLDAAIEIATRGAEVIDQTAPPMPEYTGIVQLGKPSDALKAARSKMAQNEKEALSGLNKKLASLKTQIEEERAVVAGADVDAAQAIKSGTETRESLATKRANASVSMELIADLENQVEDVKYQIQRDRARFSTMRERMMNWAQNIEIATRSYQIDCIQGRDRLRSEKYGRTMNNLLSFRVFATEHLGPELTQQLEEAITTNPIPPTLIECLFENMTPADQRKYADHKPTKTIIESGDAA